MWRRIDEDGCDWEIRVIDQAAGNPDQPEEVLEFRPVDGNRRPRRLAVPSGAVQAMSEAQLRQAYRRSLPIGGDHYGRPGKRINDA